ncbi:MAG: L-ribulose-5-phosphate 4-epimerase [Christensenellales bacterium]|jgi:L-ribulose-5-phosphate 4-epimerase
MLETLKEEVFRANMMLPEYGLITLTWGNVSARDKDTGLIVIKPSGVAYNSMKPEDMVVVDGRGRKVEGHYNPSTDTATHVALYNACPEIGGVVHTHSRWATIWSQLGEGIPALGTTHADAFYGTVPCTRELTPGEIAQAYEENTGKVIIEGWGDPMVVPAALVRDHGPFTWGKSAEKAVENAVVLEEVAMMAWHIRVIRGGNVGEMPCALLDKHYLRKHGTNAYYGQGEK